MKRQNTNWEETLADHKCNNDFVSRVRKELSSPRVKTHPIQPGNAQGTLADSSPRTRRWRAPTGKDVQCHQPPGKVKHHLHSCLKGWHRNSATAVPGEDAGVDNSYSAGGDMKRHSRCKSWPVSYKTRCARRSIYQLLIKLTTGPGTCTPEHLSQRNDNWCSLTWKAVHKRSLHIEL